MATLIVIMAISLQLGAIGAATKKPNIIFIFSDDHAIGAIGAYGEGRWKTPHIDRLAKEGMRFDRTFCANSICTPSRATVLSGQHSHKNGVLQLAPHYVFDPARGNVQELMQKGGYQTALFGKWHLISPPTGFDEWEIMTASAGQGTYYNPHMKRSGGRKDYTPQGYASDVITDLSIDWLERRDKSKPFILFSHHKAPHGDWLPNMDKYGNAYKDLLIPEPATMWETFEGRGKGSPSKVSAHTLSKTWDKGHLMIKPPGGLNQAEIKQWKSIYDEENQAYFKKRKTKTLSKKEDIRWRFQRLARNYYLTVSSLDDSIGRLLDYLDRSGLNKNTIVIYSSDQGFFVGDYGWYDKRYMYETSMRMPLIVRWPGVVKPGSVDTHLTQNLDFAQTFLDIAGVDTPDYMQGRSLLPLLKGEQATSKWRDALYYQYYGKKWSLPSHYGVRTDRYKLIRFFDKTREHWELYDLENDAEELKNEYENPEFSATRKHLHMKLDEMRKLYEVPDDTAAIMKAASRRTPPKREK